MFIFNNDDVNERSFFRDLSFLYFSFLFLSSFNKCVNSSSFIFFFLFFFIIQKNFFIIKYDNLFVYYIFCFIEVCIILSISVFSILDSKIETSFFLLDLSTISVDS